MAATLGKNCTFSGAGISNQMVRSVSCSLTAKELETQPFGGRAAYRYATGWEGALEVELIEDPNLYATLQTGAKVTVGSGPFTGLFIVAGINRTEPLDDAVTVRVTLKPAIP
jgi:hypothetical protein